MLVTSSPGSGVVAASHALKPLLQQQQLRMIAHMKKRTVALGLWTCSLWNRILSFSLAALAEHSKPRSQVTLETCP